MTDNVATRHILDSTASTTRDSLGGTGGYASLTGSGETTTPGDLTQEGGFTIIESGSTGITFDDIGSGGIGMSSNTTISMLGSHSAIDLGSHVIVTNELGANSALTILDYGTGILIEEVPGSHGDINVTNDGTGSIYLQTIGPGGINTITAGTITQTAGDHAFWQFGTSHGLFMYTAQNDVSIPTPAGTPAWAFTQDGHIYFYPSPSGPWTLVI